MRSRCYITAQDNTTANRNNSSESLCRRMLLRQHDERHVQLSDHEKNTSQSPYHLIIAAKPRSDYQVIRGYKLMHFLPRSLNEEFTGFAHLHHCNGCCVSPHKEYLIPSERYQTSPFHRHCYARTTLEDSQDGHLTEVPMASNVFPQSLHLYFTASNSSISRLKSPPPTLHITYHMGNADI